MKLFVANIKFDTREEDLKKVFETYGEVVSIKLINDRDTGRPKGFGFVEMNDEDAAEAVIGLDGIEHMGRKLVVQDANKGKKQ